VGDHQSGPVSQPGADLEYDLVHEASGAEMFAVPDDEQQREAVVTGTPEYDGDYSYDLAHDIPGR
jgi:hypothetical protein